MVKVGYEFQLILFHKYYGPVNILNISRDIENLKSFILITTDKVYKIRMDVPYRENDSLGGSDPYSSSKASVELILIPLENHFLKIKILNYLVLEQEMLLVVEIGQNTYP